VPGFARTNFHNPGVVARFNQLAALDFHLDHTSLDVLGQYQIGAASQDELGRAAQFRVVDDLAHLGLRLNADQYLGRCGQAKSVESAKVCASLDVKWLVHGRIFADTKENLMPSFDAVLDPSMVEVRNAVDQTTKEIGTRFDFKGTSAEIEFKEKDKQIIVTGDSDFQLDQVRDILNNKLTKRGVDARFLDVGKVEKIGGDKVKQVITIKAGIESDLSKKIQKVIKDSKIKVTASIQGDTVRVTGGKRDDLQTTMALLKKEITEAPLSFNNFRD
jgi:uncharacterized protein YajQ (UPF0234 family)